jgi:predicted porin
VIVDAVSLSNTWDFAERWQLAVRGDWTRRESAFDLAQTYDVVTAAGPGDPTVPAGTAVRTGSSFNSKHNVDINTDRWGVAARITHALFKNTTLYGQVSYDEQDSQSDSLGSGSDFENFLATFGVRHVFEPIPLW